MTLINFFLNKIRCVRLSLTHSERKKVTKTLLVIFSFISVVFSVLLSVLPVDAVDYTSNNFILRNPAITISGGRSTTTSFEFYSATGQTAPGESTSSGFKYQAGFLYFDQPSAEVAPTPSAGTLSVSGGGAVSASSVLFSGKAYPGATVVLLKDAQIAKTVIASQDADFTLELSGLSAVDYLFSIYARDYSGRSSRLLLFPLKLEQDKVTTINNILIPPTIAKDKKEVKKGEKIDIFGQSIPNAKITINIETPTGEFPLETFSGDDGKYRHSLGTSSLDFGKYQASSQVTFGKNTAASSSISFIIGDETIIEEPSICPPKADLNNDCAVNLVDFSILIYWFNKVGVPSKIDLNPDGVADLVDFSIMAYWWTG